MQVILARGVVLGMILSMSCVVLALKLLQPRERWVLLAGTIVLAGGVITDLATAVMSLPLLLGTGLGVYCFAFDTLCQFVLIALRNDSAHQEAQRYQKEQLATQVLLVQSLKDSESLLNDKVDRRTAELKTANKEILSAYNIADGQRIKAETAKEQAELAREQTTQAMSDLQAAQTKLIAAEKMASLGLLVSNVAHEINTPISAIQSSGLTAYESMHATLDNMPKLLDALNQQQRTLFLQLFSRNSNTDLILSSREERALTKIVTAELEAADVDGATRKARLIVKLRAHANTSDYLPLLTIPDTELILNVAASVSDVLSGTSNINYAAAKIGRIVASLKELSGNDLTSSMFETAPYQSIEKAIASLETKLHGIDVVRNYQDMALLRCDPDALQQVWAHLISNALYASNHQGVIMIGVRVLDNHAEIRIADFGCGIASDIKDRIFEPFFTTRASGEGGGMGLAIARRIIEKHQGRIDVQTEVGMGTTFTVTLPYAAAIS